LGEYLLLILGKIGVERMSFIIMLIGTLLIMFGIVGLLASSDKLVARAVKELKEEGHDLSIEKISDFKSTVTTISAFLFLIGICVLVAYWLS
jgi:tetrahydromethanopterin S-methyltransferase subunit D